MPFGTQPGRYHLLACADDRAAVAEAAEGDNCRVATHPEDGVEVPTPIQILAEGEYRVDAFSDIFDQPDEADDVADLARLSPTFCNNPATSTVSTLPAALASVHAFLNEHAPNGQALFAGIAAYHDATRAQEAAGGAIAMGRPGAALAALVRAHELEPTQASHLVNAAAVASSVGLPSEALAMLDAAERLEDPDRPAMGIGRHAVALNNRGAALAMLGRLRRGRSRARRRLGRRAAAERGQHEPRCDHGLLAGRRARRQVPARGPPPPAAEAARQLARQGHRAAQARAARCPEGGGADAHVLPEPGDQAAGRDHRPDRPRQPARGEHPAPSATSGRARRTAATARRSAASTTPPRSPTSAPSTKPSIRSSTRSSRLQRGFWGDNERDDHEYALLADAAGKWCAGSPLPNCFAQRMNETCRPKLRIAHQAWRDEMQETYGAAQTLVRAATRRMSGYAVNLADPDAHALALLQVTQYERAVYARLLQWAQHWTHSAQLYADHCVEPLDPPSSAPASARPTPTSEAACSPLLKAISGVWELGPTKLKVSCERIQQSFKAEVIPWVQAYSEVSYNFRSGRLSVFGGVKGEADGVVGKLGFKSGMYVNAERDGTVDVGWRVGPQVTVGAGPVEFEVLKDEVDISIVSTVSAMLGLDSP